MNSKENEENLLQGILGASSYSCPNPDHSLPYTIETYEDLSCTAVGQEESFRLSSNEDEKDEPFLQEFNHREELLQSDTKEDQMGLITHKKVGNTGRSVLRKQSNYPDKKWEKVLKLDSKLVELHCQGLLQEVSGKATKISQLVLTEQFCRLKIFQASAKESLKQAEFTLREFQSQKKSMLNQIIVLKNDNEALKSTIQQLYRIINELQISVESYFKRQQQNDTHQKRLAESCKCVENSITNESIQPLTHDLEERIWHQKLWEGKGQTEEVPMRDFVDFVDQLRKRTCRILKSHEISLQQSFYIPIVDKFKKDSEVRDWIVQIIKNLHQIQTGNTDSDITFGGSLLTKTNQNNTIPTFLNILRKDRAKLANDIKKSTNKELQFWFKTHSTLYTFMGILIGETKQGSLEYSPNSDLQLFCQQMAEEIDLLKQLSEIRLEPSREKYWNQLKYLIMDIKELAIFRLFRTIV